MEAHVWAAVVGWYVGPGGVDGACDGRHNSVRIAEETGEQFGALEPSFILASGAGLGGVHVASDLASAGLDGNGLDGAVTAARARTFT